MAGTGTGGPQGRGTWRRAAGAPDVRAVLAACQHVRAVEVVGAIGSTQDAARTRAADGAASGTLVVAERQTAGRGRVGRTWEDDVRPGASFAATLVLETPDHGTLVPHVLGLAVRDAVAPWLGPRAALKWPNDVVVRVDGAPRKLAGLLVERETDLGPGLRTVLLAGIGVNLDRRHLPPAADRAGVADLAGADVPADGFLAGLLAGLDAALALLARGPAAALDRYRAASDTCGRTVEVVLVDGSVLRGRADVDDEGRLVVVSTLGRHTVLAGTVRDAAAA